MISAVHVLVYADDAEFSQDIQDAAFGCTTLLKVPGAGEMFLYEPRHPSAHGL